MWSSSIRLQAVFLCALWTRGSSFLPTTAFQFKGETLGLNNNVFVCQMGLYDKPLPPRPPPRPGKNEGAKKDEIEEEWDNDDRSVESSSGRLFAFDPETGKEVNDLLPRLGRRLTSGVECYFEPSDRLVQNLVGKTSCSVEDACWALEACKGDITEAWTRISMARRMKLNTGRMAEAGGVVASLSDKYDEDEDDWDEDSYELEMQEEYQRLKSQRLANDKKRGIEDSFRGGTPDQNWLPKANPRPVDDEPWFTG